ncbi:hypothetical protein Calle1_69 [Cellulophaga phage Calle_1]|uniref:Uncharacterized protein n=1 Tax=Cellulophaga phage Calle_1 TaxID=2745643 RepID=A0A8E4ZJ26_9CAUD|nr:hypothetical protein M1M22_gp046 [Cellulophaga phage Calle_1]QQV89746.1 hypothetical protein Calle1_69 [Cellulophaga phage Calle_1]QQV89843.1 hypothetical protein Calle2_69 [Cellulophaga phage Calle_2]QQV89876.1 hypothetical protein Calle3_69 [Cellulophaga phage Calle_3]
MKFYIKVFGEDLFIGGNNRRVSDKAQAKVYEVSEVLEAITGLNERVIAVPLEYIDLSERDLTKESILYIPNTRFLLYSPVTGVFFKEPYKGNTIDPGGAYQYSLKEVKFYGGRINWALPCSEISSEVFVYSTQLGRFLKVDPLSPTIQEPELIGREGISVIL